MPFVTALIVSVVCSVASALLSPRAKATKPEAGTFDDNSIPNIKQGKSLPVIWGTVLTKSPAVVWWGDASTTPIRTKGGKK